MPNQTTARSKVVFRVAALVYFFVSVPLFSAATVLPTISVEEAIGFVVLVPFAVFGIVFAMQFVIPLVTLGYLALMVFIGSFLGGQPASYVVEESLNSTTASERFSIIDDPLLYVRERRMTYLAFVFILSAVVLGLRLLAAFNDIRS